LPEETVNPGRRLAHLHFCDPFFFSKVSLWPGRKGVARKSIGGKRNPLEGPPLFPQNEAGHRAPRGAPQHRNPPIRGGKNSLPALPQKGIVPYGFVRNPPMADFRAGQCLAFNQLYVYFSESEDGQVVVAPQRSFPMAKVLEFRERGNRNTEKGKTEKGLTP
jgi:hypothetical protein